MAPLRPSSTAGFFSIIDCTRRLTSSLHAFLSARIRCSTPGLEHVTARELERKLGALRVTVQAGSVEADIALSRKTGAEELFSLRSVEQLSAVLFSGTLPVLKSETSDGAEALEHIARAVRAVPAERWCGALTLWERCCRRRAPITPS